MLDVVLTCSITQELEEVFAIVQNMKATASGYGSNLYVYHALTCYHLNMI